MVKRIVVVAFVILTVGALAAGCGSSSSGGSATVTLSGASN